MQNEINFLHKKVDHFQSLIDARIKMQGDRAHHLEVICEHDGITWINHSMSTTIDMTWSVLRDIPAPATLIIGGIDRAEDHSKLRQLIQEKVHTIVCLGSTPWKYFEAYKDAADVIVRARDMKEAVDFAAVLSKGVSKTILFAPSCPSYDAFDNYKNRGNKFRELVNERIQLKN